MDTYTTIFGNQAPLFNGYKFILHKKNKSTIQWKCYLHRRKRANGEDVKCKTVLITDIGMTSILQSDKATHHHEPACSIELTEKICTFLFHKIYIFVKFQTI